MSATFAALGNRTYRLYFTGGAVSNVGSWVQRVAQDWLVLEIGGGAAGLGITTGLQFLPFLLLSPVGGIIADRFPKKRILQITQVSMGLLASILGVLTITNSVHVWQVYVLAFLFGVVGALDAPARQSFVVEMVGKDQLANAIGLNSASFNAARLVGPGLAGLMIVSLGTGITILANAVTYAGTFIALRFIHDDQLRTPAKVERTKGMFGDGLRYLRGRPQLLLVLAIAGIVGTFGLNFQMTSALMATQVFHKGAGEYGILGSIVAIGSLAGALLAARRGMPRGRLIVFVGGRLRHRRARLRADALLPDLRLDPAAARVLLSHAAHGRQRHDAVDGCAGDARPGDGRLPDGVPGLDTDRLADHRVGRAGVRRPLDTAGRRGCQPRRRAHRHAAARARPRPGPARTRAARSRTCTCSPNPVTRLAGPSSPPRLRASPTDRCAVFSPVATGTSRLPVAARPSGR